MVRVASSSGGEVKIEIKGVEEAIRKIRSKGFDIVNGVDANTLQASNLLQQEIQESIIGNRGEIKSVDTGNFANSISLEKLEIGKYIVFTDVPYAKFLEFGTSKTEPRMHFRNSLARNRQQIINIIKKI